MPSASVPPPSAEVLTGDATRDPELLLRVLAWAVIVFSLAQIVTFSFGRDQSIYALVGSGMLDGQVPYRDLWDFKPPGIFFIYASAFFFLGKSMVAPRLIEAACLFGVVLGLRRLGGTLFQSRTAGLLGGAIAALVHAELDFWHSGQPETFAGALTISALVLGTHPFGRRHLRWVSLAIGALSGACFLLKPPLGGVALPILWYAASQSHHALPKRAQRVKGALFSLAWGAAGAAVPIALSVLWFQLAGGYEAMSYTLGVFAPGYTALGWAGRSGLELYLYAWKEILFFFSGPLTLGILLFAWAEFRNREARKPLALVVAVLAIQLAGVALQAKFFQYHYGASVPVLALLSGVGIYRLFRRICLDSLLGHLAFVGCLVVAALARLPVRDVPEGFWTRSGVRLGYLASLARSVPREELDRRLYYVADYSLDGDRQAVVALREHLRPGDHLYVWGFEPLIYWLGDFQPSSRYIYNVPQRATWQAERPRRELLADLAQHPPSALVVQHADVFPFVTGNHLGSGDSLALFPDLEAWAHERYSFSRRVEDFEIWLPKERVAVATRPPSLGSE